MFINKDALPIYDTVKNEGVIVPYSLPPRPYTKTDKPGWIADLTYSQLDTHGNKWPLPVDVLPDLLQ